MGHIYTNTKPMNAEQKEKQDKLFMVLYYDEQGLSAPMGHDPDCEGAICAVYSNEKILLFQNRKSARKAIDISAKHAALLRAQGKPENTDFLEGRKYLTVVECEIRKETV